MQRDFCDVAIDMMILKEKLGVENIVLSGGEPTYHPQFLEIVKYASRMFKTAVISNGFNPKLLTETSSKAKIWVSLDYYGKKQDVWRKAKGLWKNYTSIAEIANIRTTLLKGNLTDTEKLIQQAVKHEKEITIVPCKTANPQLAPSPEQLQKLLIFIFENSYADKAVIDCPSVNFYIKQKTAENLTEDTLCTAAQQVMRVDPEGNIHPCPFLNMKICNITDVDITQKLAQTRQEIINTYTGKCQTCTYAPYCGGCKAGLNAECFFTSP
jgi:radical SAM protein with 4Fe4S-binding SPASM domain